MTILLADPRVVGAGPYGRVERKGFVQVVGLAGPQTV